MGASFKLAGELTMNEGDFTRGLGKADSALKSFFKGAAAGAAGFLAANVIAKGISAVSNGVKSAISDASDLNESMNKSNVIFGENADVIADWSKSAAQNFGLSKQAALETTGTLGNLFKGMGIGADANADMSMKTVAAAADLASFNNVAGGTEQVLADIQSGLVGEVEPLRKYGILLNEAKVGQKAMAMTGKANVKQLTEGEKVAARYALIMDQIGDAQGDFARTSGDAANASRIFHAQMTNLSASIGGKLLPILTRTTDAANRFLSRFDDKRAQGFGVWEAGLSALHTTLDQVFGKTAGDAMIAVISGIGGALDDGVQAIGRIVSAMSELAGLAFSGDIGGFFDTLFGDLASLASQGFDLGVIAVTAAFELASDVVHDLWAWFVEQVMGKQVVGDATGGPEPGGRQVSIGTVLVTAALQLLDGILGGAASLWDWFRSKIIGGQVTGDGTGGPDPGNRQISIGSVLIDAALSLGGALLAISGNFGIWLKAQLLKGQQQLIDIGVLKVTGTPDLRAINQKIGQALNSIDWNNLGFQAGQLTAALVVKFGEAIAGLASWLASGGNWQTVAKALAAALLGLPLAIGYLGFLLGPKALEFIQGFLTGLGVNWPNVENWLKGLPAKALTAVGDMTATLLEKGSELLAGLKTGAETKWSEFTAWLSQRPAFAATWMGDVTATLLQKGIDLLTGFKTGVDQFWASDVVPGLQAIPQGAIDAVGDLSATLMEAGGALMNGLKSGVDDIWANSVVPGLQGVGPGAVDAVGDLGGVLYNAGASLVQGLIDGVNEKIADLQAALSSITSLIPSWKGPREKDRMLLHPAGQFIMSGLMRGIDSQVPALQNQLRAISLGIPAMAIPVPSYGLNTFGTGARGANRPATNGGGFVINNYGTINVPEGYSDFRSAMSAWASGEAQA